MEDRDHTRTIEIARAVATVSRAALSAGTGVLSAIGNTPLVELTRLGVSHARLFAKLDFLNPGGSSKDRPALFMLRAGLDQGLIGPDTVVIESSSGNMGVGLAQACRYLGLHFICVVDAKTTAQNMRLLHAYGAEVIVVERPNPDTHEFLDARLAKVRELLGTIPNAYWTNQYENDANVQAHCEQTGRELVEALGAAPDYVYCPTSTCGTIAGLVRHFRDIGAPTRICAVDLVGSVIFGGESACRLIPGLGSSRRPAWLARGDVADIMHVTDLDCVAGCRLLASREALLVGGSSGGALLAALRTASGWPPGSSCVLVLPDRGERYLDTVFDDAWVKSHFGPGDQLREIMATYDRR